MGGREKEDYGGTSPQNAAPLQGIARKSPGTRRECGEKSGCKFVDSQERIVQALGKKKRSGKGET